MWKAVMAAFYCPSKSDSFVLMQKNKNKMTKIFGKIYSVENHTTHNI